MDALRVPLSWADDLPQLDHLLTVLVQPVRLVEEIVFFTSPYHAPATHETLLEQLVPMARAFEKVRDAGFRVGLNHLATIGHHDENLEQSVGRQLRRQVGIDGKTCLGSLCPADPAVRAYVQTTYEILAATHPDILWVDDDVRLGGHMPTHSCCMCEYCIADFSQQVGTQHTHASLVAVLDGDEEPSRIHTRVLFLQRNARVLRELLALIAQATHRVDPKVELGFMTGDRFWEGYAFEGWADALRGNGRPVRWRPGGGFYADTVPRELLDKAHAIGRQAAALPDNIANIQSEIENFPYQPLLKSSRANVLETTAYLFTGCTGAAFNILSMDNHDLVETLPLLQRLRECKPRWDAINLLLAGSRPVGAWVGWHPMQVAHGRAQQRHNGFADMSEDMDKPYVLAELGVPVCYERTSGCFAALAGRVPLALGPKVMRELLAHGVLLDAEAVLALQQMGLDDLTGVEVGKSHTDDTTEQFTDHVFNGDYAGWKRDGRQSFRAWNVTAYELLPRSDDTQILAEISSYAGQSRGASATVFTNPLGGRVAVLSYFPWTLNKGLGKRTQLLRVCDWLSDHSLPAMVNSYCHITPFARKDPDGRLIIGLLNLGMDPLKTVEVAVRHQKGLVQHMTATGELEALACEAQGDTSIVTLTDVPPFSFETLVCE